MSELTVLSLGAGQESTAILYKMIYDAEFRTRYAPKQLLVVCSDTKDEHQDTYTHIEKLKELCRASVIEFVHITADMGFHKGNWIGLKEFYRATTTYGCKCYRKSCADNLKIRPIFRFLEFWIGDHYRVTTGRKRGFYAFRSLYGKISVLIGIAKGEESRISTDGPKWMLETIERVYPLLDLGWDRRQCQRYILDLEFYLPPPSNCVMCPFKSDIEILWTARRYPERFAEWVEIERNKLDRYVHLGRRNLAVFGEKTLPEVLSQAERKYQHMTDADLDEYRMSHGHCVRSKY